MLVPVAVFIPPPPEALVSDHNVTAPAAVVMLLLTKISVAALTINERLAPVSVSESFIKALVLASSVRFPAVEPVVAKPFVTVIVLDEALKTASRPAFNLAVKDVGLIIAAVVPE